ncbi:hypothetical protein TWF788_008247 [Orbilia oligospora]|uniref:Uncharacterized protein n=1 Tax=Orbilia oligospora TaxID=2813651 RepID=A0A7C8U1E2_ORBOL|nr:hypothetical protein TWF788_008247 [Orbilia oligospora]
MSAPPPPPQLSLVRPTVPKPALTAKKDPGGKPKKQNLNTTLIREAFNDQYWLERTGNWSQIFPLENVLTLIQVTLHENIYPALLILSRRYAIKSMIIWEIKCRRTLGTEDNLVKSKQQWLPVVVRVLHGSYMGEQDVESKNKEPSDKKATPRGSPLSLREWSRITGRTLESSRQQQSANQLLISARKLLGGRLTPPLHFSGFFGPPQILGSKFISRRTKKF